MSDILDAARRYHALGWSIIPIKPASKLPACAWKRFQDLRASGAQVQTWFGNGRPLSLAVVCGDVSGGLVVRDFDTKESYQQWANANAVLAKLLPTVGTRRGRHVYCRADLGTIRHVSKSAGGILVLGDGELRGGGYVLLPPSTHPDGGRYRWLVPLEATLPEVDLLEAGLLPCNRDNGEYGANVEYGEYLGEPRTLTSSVECPPLSLVGDWAWRMMRRNGLPIAYVGVRAYVFGDDLLNFFRQMAKTSGGGRSAVRAEEGGDSHE